MIEKIQIGITLLSIFALVSCKKDSEPPKHPLNDRITGTCTVVQDDKEWIGYTSAFLSPNSDGDLFTLSLDSLDQVNRLREHIGILNIPMELGTYSMTDSIFLIDRTIIRGTYGIADFDVLLGFYDPIGINSKVTITSLDTISRKVEGVFEFIAVADWKSSLISHYPDTIAFTNGHFEATIVE